MSACGNCDGNGNGAGSRACPLAVCGPIATSTAMAAPRQPGAARLMVVEYSKYLAILGREAVLGLGPRTTPAAPNKG